jgi:glycosyltransferase involved in cell wall biosynthesis
MPAVIKSLRPYGLSCIMVNDGSSAECRQVLDGLAAREGSWVGLVHLEQNQGKGGAVMAGLREAAARGFSHAIQIDADGQHHAPDLPRFLDAAKNNPDAVICGQPVFDESIPWSRFYGRKLTNGMIWVNSMSFAIEDAMCGFRLYPLKAMLELMNGNRLGRRMDFDPEVLVRLCWKGLRFVNVPTKVSDPADGRSHFLMGLDNWLITNMHIRLFFGMLLRAPLLLLRKIG